jgi:hypothetical protein
MVSEFLGNFVFTLRNQYLVPAWRFALKAKEVSHAMFCNCNSSLRFMDIMLWGDCKAVNLA